MTKSNIFKKIIAVTMIATVLTLGLASCGSKEEVSSSFESSTSSSESSLEPITSSAPPQEPESDILKKLKDLREKNTEVVGWLEVPNTDINDALLYKPSDTKNLYYLRKNNLKQYDFNGCYFIDYSSKFGKKSSELGQNTIIYGHTIDAKTIPDGPKFAQAYRYKDLEFAKKSPYIYITTPDEKLTFKVFSAGVVNWNDTPFHHGEYTDAKMNEVIDEMIKASNLNFNVDVNSKDKLLTLSTCTYTGTSKQPDVNTRFVVMARLMRNGESETDTVSISVNPKPTIAKK